MSWSPRRPSCASSSRSSSAKPPPATRPSKRSWPAETSSSTNATSPTSSNSWSADRPQRRRNHGVELVVARQRNDPVFRQIEQIERLVALSFSRDHHRSKCQLRGSPDAYSQDAQG